MKTKLLLFAVVLFATCLSASAKKWLINLGGPFGNIYSPNTVSVEVGDTIEWVGSFSTHPLLSTAVPSGASTFANNTGSLFDYPVTVDGEYTYKCTVHGAFGMPGQFTATVPAGINETIAANVKIFPSVTHDAVSVILPANNEKLSLSLFNVEGRLIHQSIAPAAGTASLDMGALNNGMYLLVIRNDNT